MLKQELWNFNSFCRCRLLATRSINSREGEEKDADTRTIVFFFFWGKTQTDTLDLRNFNSTHFFFIIAGIFGVAFPTYDIVNFLRVKDIAPKTLSSTSPKKVHVSLGRLFHSHTTRISRKKEREREKCKKKEGGTMCGVRTGYVCLSVLLLSPRRQSLEARDSLNPALKKGREETVSFLQVRGKTSGVPRKNLFSESEEEVASRGQGWISRGGTKSLFFPLERADCQNIRKRHFLSHSVPKNVRSFFPKTCSCSEIRFVCALEPSPFP